MSVAGGVWRTARARCGPHDCGPRRRAGTVACMPLYVVPRSRAWRSEEELAATSDCAPDVAALYGITLIRSYLVTEEDGTLGSFCIYDAPNADVLREYSAALRLPADAVKPVLSCMAPEPVAAAAAA